MKFEEEIRKHQQEQIEHIEKSIDFSCDRAIYDEIEKARSGVYSDTTENRKSGKVGQKYGSEKKREESKDRAPNSTIQEGVDIWIKATKENNPRIKKELITEATQKIKQAVESKIDLKKPKESFDNLEKIESQNPLVRTIISNYQDKLRHSVKLSSTDERSK